MFLGAHGDFRLQLSKPREMDGMANSFCLKEALLFNLVHCEHPEIYFKKPTKVSLNLKTFRTVWFIDNG